MKNKKQKKKKLSTYEQRKLKYPYSFHDGITLSKETKVAGLGLKEPDVAEDYALELLNITEELLEGNYRIIDCLATFSDDDYGNYGQMELIKNGQRFDDDIERWKDYYLRGEGRRKRDICKDLISRCTLHMNLEHVKGRPFLSVTDYQIWNLSSKEIKSNKSKKKSRNKRFKLHHSMGGRLDFKTGKFIEYNRNAWCDTKPVY